MSGRFDYTKFDSQSIQLQESIKVICVDLEKKINEDLGNGRYKALALTKLEECYMHVGKAVRDDQLYRELLAKPSEDLPF